MKKLNLFVMSTLLASSLALAQTATQTTETTTAPQPATAGVPSNKLTSEFSGWAGSQENANSLVNGLRTGTAITLTSAGAGGTTTTFVPPTRPMGYGNIRIALLLAKTQLASQGITDPTATQLQGALLGTSGSSTQGILQMRASGMGWGQIANSMGVKLGAVVSGKQIVTPTTTTGKSTATSSAHGHKSGVVTASGSAAGGRSSGITSAAGASGKVTTGLGHAHGHGVSAGVVNAGGGRASGAAGSNAGGNGKGNGKP